MEYNKTTSSDDIEKSEKDDKSLIDQTSNRSISSIYPDNEIPSNDTKLSESENVEGSIEVDVQEDIQENIQENNHEDVQEVIYPTYKLFRNDKDEETTLFMPGDLITLILENTGNTRKTTVTMLDRRDEPRFHGVSGGSSHKWITKIQKTKVLGTWKFVASGLMMDETQHFQIEIPYELVEMIEEPIVELVEEPIDLIEEDIELRRKQIALITKLKIPVIEIKGIGPNFEKRLHDAEIYHFKQFIESSPQSISDLIFMKIHTVEKWYDFIEEVVTTENHPLILKYSPKPEEHGKEPPSVIKGIGKVTEQKLIDAGFTNVHSIATVKANELVEKMNVSITKAEKWIKDAKNRLKGKTIKKEIKIKKSKLKIDPNDEPIKIIGVGPVTNKKLVAAGFQTIRSIANANFEELSQLLTINKAKKLIKDAKSLVEHN